MRSAVEVTNPSLPTLSENPINDFDNSKVTLKISNKDLSSYVGGYHTIIIQLYDNRDIATKYEVYINLVFMPGCDENDLKGVTFSNEFGDTFTDYTYYRDTQGEKVFNYLFVNEPTCLGYTTLK